MTTRLLLAYDPATETEYLVTLWPDGTGELAHRPGQDNRGARWSVPLPLKDDQP